MKSIGMPGTVRQMPVATRARLRANHDQGLILSPTDRDSSVHRFQFEISHQHFAPFASRKNVSYPLRDQAPVQSYCKVDLCRILPHIFSGDTSYAFLSSRISAGPRIFFEWLSLAGQGKRVIALIAIHRKASTWHHYCEINFIEPH
jgi:hypothetical protein